MRAKTHSGSVSRERQCLEERVVHGFQCIRRKGVSQGPSAWTCVCS